MLSPSDVVMRKRMLILVVVVVVCLFTLQPQSAHAQTPKAYKFAEFGPTSAAKVAAKMKDFYVLVKKDDNLEGYIINYGTPKAIRARKKIINQSVTFRYYDAPRITFVDGPVEPKIRTVMWVVPSGAEKPVP